MNTNYKPFAIAASMLAGVALLIVLSMSHLNAADSARMDSNPQQWTGSSTFTTGIVHNTSATITNGVYFAQGKDLLIQIKLMLNDAGTTAGTLAIQQSVDGTTYQTFYNVACAISGSTATTTVTNIAIGAGRYIKFATLANPNANTGDITNVLLQAYTK